MNRISTIWLVVAALTVAYVTLSGLGITGLETGTGEAVYRLIVIAALSFSCARVFAGRAVQTDAVLAGVLGLAALAIFEIYSLAHLYLLGGSPTDITLNSYNRNCAYLFFMSAVALTVPPVSKARTAFRAVLGTIASAVTVLIFYTVLVANHWLLYWCVLIMSALCSLSAVFLLWLSHGKGRPHAVQDPHGAKFFAVSLAAFCLLDTVSRLLVINDFGPRWREIVAAFYPGTYLLIGFALIRLRKQATDE